jgi:two-component system LytT family response regulator
VGPLTNTLRYVVLFYPAYDWGAYFPEYVLTGRMYANYVLPCLLVGYGLVNGNLFLDYNDYQKRQLTAVQPGGLAQASGLEPISPESAYLTHLEASDAEGEALLRVSEIWYIEVDKKQYLAYTAGQTYQLRRSLADLEACLSPYQFYRLNRSVLVNLAYLKNYSYWEHDKYIVRLKDDKTEFTMQRTRLKALKERLPMAESFVASRPRLA